MVFVTAVRDYIDFINDNLATLGQGMSTPQIVQQTALYVVESCKLALLYIVTLQWLRDFTYLPILIPKYTGLIYKEALVLAGDPSLNIFTFGETPTIVQNKFFVGFFNSIFACLPFSCAHLVALRRFYLQGWPVALTTSLGIIAGHFFFLTSVLFGWRSLIFPWLHLEPWNYIIGLVLITNIVYNFSRPAGVAQHRRLTSKDLQVYISTGLVAFLLTLCEQGVIFQHITTFTVGLEPSFLEPLTGTSQNLVLAHSIYILGFLLGSFVFTFLSYGAAVGFRFIITQICRITEVRFHMYYQRYSRYLIMVIALTTIPFYGLDYFVINPLGFIPNDTALTRGSLFAPNTELDSWFKEHNGQYSEGIPELLRTYPAMADYPLAGFDRGIYLSHKVGLINPDSGTGQDFVTDEDYMLPVENAWRSRRKREKTERRDLMMRHKASLQRIKFWLRKIAPNLSESEKSRLEQGQQKEAGSDNKEAAAFAARAKRNKQWVPEQFNQFTILDHYSTRRKTYRLPLPKEILVELIDDGHQLLKKKGNFRKNHFERITKLEDTLDTVKARKRAQTDDFLQEGRRKNLRRLSDKTLRNVSRYSLVQDFEKQALLGLNTSFADPNDSRNFYFLRLWEYMNTFLPEEVQSRKLKSNNLKVPFQRRKHRHFNRSFRNNVYYKPLMRTDIDAFLNRQPKHHALMPAEEAELYFKRTMLSDYYNSMRRYKNMNNKRRFLLAYGGTKSLAHKVYNHQFKGSYRVARRLLSVDLRPANQPNSLKNRQRVLKYDQPLYDETKSHNPMLHEELQKRREDINQDLQRKATRSQKARGILRAKRLPFFRAANTRPFYCGWDTKKRQFVLTNRYAPRKTAGMKGLHRRDPKKGHLRRLTFKSWPIKNPYYTGTEDSLNVNLEADRWNDKNLRGVFPTNRRNRLDYKKKANRYLANMFDPLVSPSEEQYGRYYALRPDPSGLRPWEKFPEWPAGFDMRAWMQPIDWWHNEYRPTPFADRGGFVWPGHEKLKDQYLPKEIKEALGKQPQKLLVEAIQSLRDKAEIFSRKIFT